MKRIALLALVMGLLLLLAGAVMPVVYWQYYTSNNPGAGIIGGADTPTYGFLLLNWLHGLPFLLVLSGVSLAVTALFSFLFRKTVLKCCHRGTSLIALSLSAVGGAGLTCALEWFAIVTLSSVKKYPIAYPLSVAGGLAALLAFFGLIALYFWQRSKHWSVRGIVIDVLTSILYLPTFFWAFNCLLVTIH